MLQLVLRRFQQMERWKGKVHVLCHAYWDRLILGDAMGREFP